MGIDPVPTGSNDDVPMAPTIRNTAEDGVEQSTPADSPGITDLDREIEAAMAAMPSPEALLMGEDVTDSADVPPGAELTGTVVGLSDGEVFVEFGVKSQGVVMRSQFGLKEPLEVGRRVDLVVERYDAEAGLLILNRAGAAQRATWRTLSVGMLVDANVTGLIKGGLELDLQGIRAFMPGSQASLGPMKDISVLLGEKIRCEVVELDRRHKNVVVSRRRLLERERREAREKLQEELEVGQLRRGTVQNITDFGAFVDLGGLEGLLHISDLAWSTVDKVTDVLSPGQEVEVKVLKIDTERNRISLGLKQTLPDPWAEVSKRHPVGTTMKVRITRLADFGAFAELEPGVEGLLPLSELGWTRVNRTSDVVSVGDVVDARVIRVEPARRRIALSIKQAQPDPWDGVLDGFTERSLAAGKVTRIAAFGAFVELLPGVEGLIHISELSDRRVRSCEDVVEVGQEVEARVLGVDRESRRISLSLKQAKAPEPSSMDGEPAASDQPKPRPKRKKPLRGGLSSHFNW